MTLPSQGVLFDLGTREIREFAIGSQRIDRADPKLIYWIHLNSLDPALLEKVADLSLSPRFLEEFRRPKSLGDLNIAEDQLTLITHYWEPTRGTEETPAPRRLGLYLSERCCLTIALEPIPALERFQATYRTEFRFAETSGFILFLILENLVEDFAKILHRFDEQAEEIDDEIHGDFPPGLNHQILRLKRQLITLKHYASSLRDLLMKLSGRRIGVISESCRLSLGDVYHHAEMVVNQLESQWEMIASFLDAYNAALSKKMNDTIKILTIFSAVILPLSLIAGIYGMNFKVMPELDWKYGYAMALGLMGIIGFGLVRYFKKKGWL